MQKWNHIRNMNYDLVFIDFSTLKTKELHKDITTKDWTSEKLNSEEIKFTFRTTDNDLIYIVRQKEINKNIETDR